MENLIKIDQLPFDMRAEVLARLVADKYNLQTEQVLVHPQKYYQRWGRKDILSISEEHSVLLDKDTLMLDVSREGLFDALPESIFLHPDDKYRDYIHRVNKLTEQEAHARKFLLPFEQMFYWLRLENEQREAYGETQLETWWQHLLIDGYTPFSNSKLDEDQLEMLTQMLPYLHDIVGNWSLTEQWLTVFLKTNVLIFEMPPRDYELPVELQKRLDDGVLGQDFVIGTHFSDAIPTIKICINDLTPNTLGEFLEGGRRRLVLENELLSLLLPIETPYDVELNLKIQNDDFYLGEFHDSAILGFTTCVNL
jgi:type VI secretion system protein ImpH